MKYIVGVDEVGRGPIAGPVTVCAFIIPAETDLLLHFKNRKLKDSKKLSPLVRKKIQTEFNKRKIVGELDFVISSKSAEYIDTNGLTKAVQSCITDCLNKLRRLNYPLDGEFTMIHLDGSLKIPEVYIEKISKKFNEKIVYDVTVKGDEKIAVIACASIIAKVVRDNYMHYIQKKIYNTSSRWYNWANNAGYGTKEHYELIEKYGLTQYHRKSFLTRYVRISKKFVAKKGLL